VLGDHGLARPGSHLVELSAPTAGAAGGLGGDVPGPAARRLNQATESLVSSCVVRTKTTGTRAARAASTSDTSRGTIATAALTSSPFAASAPSIAGRPNPNPTLTV
jgi:hypothetical protein